MFAPAEFVEIQPGQSIKAKLNSQESTAMVQFACRSPYANLFSISTDARETLGLDDETMVCVAVIQPHMIEADISRANSASKSISNP